jgi:hypothetical protein
MAGRQGAPCPARELWGPRAAATAVPWHPPASVLHKLLEAIGSMSHRSTMSCAPPPGGPAVACTSCHGALKPKPCAAPQAALRAVRGGATRCAAPGCGPACVCGGRRAAAARGQRAPQGGLPAAAAGAGGGGWVAPGFRLGGLGRPRLRAWAPRRRLPRPGAPRPQRLAGGSRVHGSGLGSVCMPWSWSLRRLHRRHGGLAGAAGVPRCWSRVARGQG